MIHTSPPEAARKPSTHLQPAFILRNPPMIGPRAGPKKGAAAYKLSAKPRWRAVNKSDIVPPAFVNGADPNAPAKKRRITSDQIF